MLFEFVLDAFKAIALGAIIKFIADEMARQWQSKAGPYRLDATSLMLLDVALLLIPKNFRRQYYDEWFVFLCDEQGAWRRFLQALGLVSAAFQIKLEHWLEFCQSRYVQNAAKRVFDFSISATALLYLAPLLLIVGLCISATGSPVFRRTEAIGVNGKKYSMWRFNTAKSGRISVFLRRVSIDELPLLFNIVAGDMSLVGPTALSIMEHDSLPEYLRHQLSLEMRPGLVSLAGINGFPFDPAGNFGWLGMDRQYAQKWSLLLDLKILSATLQQEFFGRTRSGI